MSEREEFAERVSSGLGDNDALAGWDAGWQAAKESSRKELEAAKQRVAELEEANTSNTFWKAEFLKEKEALEKNLAAQEKQLTSFRLAFFDIAGGEDAVQGVEELTKHK